MNNNNLDKFLKLNSDYYFKKTKKIILDSKDINVTYAKVMRSPVIFCPQIAVNWLEKVEKIRKAKFDIKICHKEGAWVGAGEPLISTTFVFSFP